MHVIEETAGRTTEILAVPRGTCFKYKMEYYIASNRNHTQTQCVNLETGGYTSFSNSTHVIPMCATITVMEAK